MKKNLLIAFCALFSTTGLFAQNGEILWGGAGDPNSEFDGGLNDWTVNAISNENAVWVWEEDGRADLGAYSGTTPINSPSAGNGAAVFDGDFYDTGGVAGDFGLGPAAGPHESELISPIMDLSGIEGGVSLKFNQYYRVNNNNTSVAYSSDGGETWSNPQFFNDEIPSNEATAATSVKTIPLFGAELTENFRVKFIYGGTFYFWIIDDVQIISRSFNDLQVNENFYAIAPNRQTPASQVENFGFLVDITNNGGLQQTGVVVNMTIEDEDGDVLYTADNEYGAVGDSLVENSSFGGFTPPAEEGTYTGTYTISSDSVDINPDNDQLSFSFVVTDTVFAKESGVTRTIYPAAGNWEVGDPRQWAYGNYYYVPNGDGYFASTATFSIVGSDETAGTVLDVRLYKWDDADNNGNLDPDERDAGLVGFALYEIQGNESQNGLITIDLTAADFSGAPALEDNSAYVIMLEYAAEDDTQELFFGASNAFDYGAMVLNSDQQGAPRYAALLGIAGNLTSESYSNVGFGRDLVPVVRLNVTEEPSRNNNVILAENTLVINPNPASEVLNAQLNFADNVEKATLRLLDAQGRIVATKVLQDVQTANASMDINNLPAGNYFLNVQTANGQLTKNVVVK